MLLQTLKAGLRLPSQGFHQGQIDWFAFHRCFIAVSSACQNVFIPAGAGTNFHTH
jgi:hypothetical protein